MGKDRHELTVEEKNIVLKLLSEDFTHADVGKYVGVSRACITRFLSRYRSRKTVENLPRTGRPPKTSLRDDRHILRVVKSNRRQSLREITNTVNNDLSIAVSSRTIRRRLRSCGYRRRKIRKSLTIARVNRLRRLSWCKTKLSWQAIGKWRSVIFSDETQVVLDHSRNVYVWRKPHKIWLPDCLGKRGGRPRISAMFWGCITYDGVGILVPVDGNIDSQKYTQILDANLLPVVAKRFAQKPFIFQDDNAPAHSSKFTRDWKIKNEIPGMTWPAQSPDLNIIENVWRIIKLRLQSETEVIQTRAELINAVCRIWRSLPVGYIRNLYASIPRRLRSVIIGRGFPTKY